MQGWPLYTLVYIVSWKLCIMNLHKTLVILSISLFGAGLALAAPLGLLWLQQRQALAAMAAEPSITTTTTPAVADTKPNVVQGTPVHIVIPSLGIDAPVSNGYYDPHTGQWTLSEGSAYYATPTSLANSDTGNTFIYGHNSQKIFGKLLNIQTGAEATVTTDNGYAFTYIYQSTVAVPPTDVGAALTYSGPPRLTLQTCSGLWHQTRQMVYFTLKEYRKV
jgi:LPXTG-site transpeptidase (sortase) family protein